MEITTIKGAVYNKFGSYTKFAAALGWTQQRLSKLIAGHKIPNVLELAEIAAALDMPLGDVAMLFIHMHSVKK